jgi:hypothetical protein
MTAQPDNKANAEQKISKDELSDKDVDKVTGGAGNTTATTTSSSGGDKPTESVSLNFTKINATYTP